MGAIGAAVRTDANEGIAAMISLERVTSDILALLQIDSPTFGEAPASRWLAEQLAASGVEAADDGAADSHCNYVVLTPPPYAAEAGVGDELLSARLRHVYPDNPIAADSEDQRRGCGPDSPEIDIALVERLPLIADKMINEPHALRASVARYVHIRRTRTVD